ncbi:CueP family metal-binding protein [Nocardiopsis valliformis]|uniref:CueP family metal-binding protein n=1 Tax=Nocardiopsis valliformis TaxID=239974 RepID=UPI000475FAE1|nr:CueP family metal-binding protein [Nocardiopsis valliformis]
MRYTAMAGLAAAALVLTACAGSEEQSALPDETGNGTAGEAAPESGPGAELLAEHGLDGLTAEEIVDRLDLLPVDERPTGLVASVRSDVLVLADGPEGEEVELGLPEDLFYLSMAPYVDHTHDCFFHSLTSCLGELRGEAVAVTVTDDSDGTVLVEEDGTTFDNGFVGYWLPRGVDATVTVEHEGRSGTAQVSTGEDDPTCLTALELS